MWIHLHHTDKTVQQVIRAAFPGHTGKKIVASIQDTVSFFGTNWDGGCKNTYVLVRLSDMMAMQIAEAPYFQQSELHSVAHNIPDGFVVVKEALCRSPYMEIIGPASNINPMLPAPTEITHDERIVLCATRCLKSSYGGISNYRFHEAKERTGITLERWEAAKAVLIGKKLLNAAGAITVDGKNVNGRTELYELREAPTPLLSETA